MMAWQTAHLMNIHIVKGPPVTMKKLLGPAFFEDSLESEVFDTREKWEAHKADLREKAAYHARVLRLLKSGKKKGKTVTRFDNVVRKEH